MTSHEIAKRYYQAFTEGGDWSRVPMKSDLTFVGPMMSIDGAAKFRETLAGLSTQVRSLQMRRQIVKDDLVLSFYDFDMGKGPIAMAEALALRGGEIADVELIFDKSAL